MPPRMSPAEREAFLAEPHVGVLSIPEPDTGGLVAPVWYAYEPGGLLWFVTARSSRKGKALEQAPRISLVAQAEDPPYRYVSVEGPVVDINRAELEQHRRPLAHRYLGEAAGDRYVDGSPQERNIVVTLRPERWLAVDYGKASAGRPSS